MKKFDVCWLTKLCGACSTARPINDFYRNASRYDGHQVHCKACWRADSARRKIERPDHVRRMHRESAARNKRPMVHAAKPYDDKVKARRKLQIEVRNGRIERGDCEVCGTPKADAHHDDYSRPLDVRWLCRMCHATHHRLHRPGAA